MKNILSLEEYLPIYDEFGTLIKQTITFQIEESSQDVQTTENSDAISSWVNDAGEQGKIGENWVRDILKRDYNVTAEKMIDRAGYDFKVVLPNDKEVFIEVKTSSNHRFFISRNEINTAKEKGNDYYIFYVEATGSGQNAVCQNLYAMQNPFETLGLSWIFNADTNTDMALMLVQSIEIRPKDFQGFTIVPLNH